MTGTLTDRIAAFAADPTHDSLPPEVIHAVRRAILDSIGVAVAGSRHAAFGAVLQLVGRATGPCAVIGAAHRTDPVNAALANGIAAHVLDFDDTILPTRAHLSAALLPPLFAVGELHDWTISQVVPAFAIGFEIQSRINLAVYPSVHLRGWQGTGMAGGPGSAAAVGRLLGLSPVQIAHAMGIAATGASGLIATFGSMSKALNIGRAGASGLQSAFLAQSGFTSNPDIFGAGRYLEMYDDNPRHAILADGLALDWAILRNGYKPYPCGFVAHAMIDAVRELRDRTGGHEGLRRMQLTVSQESTHLMGSVDPRNELEAKFSLVYAAAVAWVDGNVTPAAFEAAAVRAPRYRKVMPLISIVASPEVAQHEARAKAVMDDEKTYEVHVANARGTPARPLSDADLAEKFTEMIAAVGLPNSNLLHSQIIDGDDLRIRALMECLQTAGR